MMIPVHEIAQSLGTLDGRSMLGSSCRQGLRRYILNSAINAVRRVAFSPSTHGTDSGTRTSSSPAEQRNQRAAESPRSNEVNYLRLVGGRDLESE